MLLTGLQVRMQVLRPIIYIWSGRLSEDRAPGSSHIETRAGTSVYTIHLLCRPVLVRVIIHIHL